MNENIKEFLIKTGRSTKQYLKGTLISAAITFIVIFIGLMIADVSYYGLIAFVIAVVDLLPIIGSGIILIPWSIISYAAGNSRLALILILLFLITFLIEQFIEPLIIGKSLGLKPVYTIAISLLSMIIFTPVMGAIIGSVISIVLSVIIDLKKVNNDISSKI